MNKNIFIVIEGLDGVGKTAVTNYFARKYGYKVVKTPTYPLQSLRRLFDYSKNATFRMLYYLLASVIASFQICHLLKKSHVICDRYIISTIAYHECAGANTTIARYISRCILHPNLSIHLTATEDIRNARMAHRSSPNLYRPRIRWDALPSNLQRQTEVLIGQLCDIEIDTSQKQIDEIAQLIYSSISFTISH